MTTHIMRDEFGFYGICSKCKRKMWIDTSDRMDNSLCLRCWKNPHPPKIRQDHDIFEILWWEPLLKEYVLEAGQRFTTAAKAQEYIDKYL
jgi:hypothetical protein